jgi:H+/Cl- antiporter ClcA
MSYKKFRINLLQAFSIGAIIGVIFIIIGMVVATIWQPILQFEYNVTTYLVNNVGWWAYPILFVIGMIVGFAIFVKEECQDNDSKK